MTFEKPDFNFITLDAGTSTTSGQGGAGVESCVGGTAPMSNCNNGFADKA